MDGAKASGPRPEEEEEGGAERSGFSGGARLRGSVFKGTSQQRSR